MSTQPQPTPDPRETEPTAHETGLEEVVRRVARDARRAPEAYLNETLVPEGGE